jgi:hypothetical protein
MTSPLFQGGSWCFLFIAACASLPAVGAQTASPSPSIPAEDNSSQANPAASPSVSPVVSGQTTDKGDAESPSPSEPPATEATPPQQIPPASSPSPQPASTEGLPAAAATPNKTPIDPSTAKALDDQFQEALKIHHLRPKKLLALGLTNAVRIALVQNSDLRLGVKKCKVPGEH